MMLAAVISGFLVGGVAPWVIRYLGDSRGSLALAALPALLFVYFASFVSSVAGGETARMVTPWAPGLDLMLSFYVDGLSLSFALLISGIGTFIVIYAGSYLHDHPQLGRFYIYLLGFMASMLGLVLADNIITLFVFWELTSLTSFLLIGFNHEQEKSRKLAVQAMLVTVAGGLAMLAGLIMMAVVTGTFELSEMMAEPDVLKAHAHYTIITILILVGAFSKSAQAPLHFWLPNAMEAPTPVSAYLHSSTMVKAGVYLMARMHPGLGGTDFWIITLSLFGGVTMFLGVFLAIQQTEIKKVLAYSTVMALGTLTMLIGIGTDGALIAASVFLLAHAFYKAALFLIAGIIDHEAGTKDITKMGGLRHSMPITAAAATVAGFSLAGIPPFFGFLAKEMLLEATLDADLLALVLTLLAVGAGALVVAVAGIVVIRPFYGAKVETPKKPHEAPMAMLVGPLVLGLFGIGFGLMPGLAERTLVGATAAAMAGEPVDVTLYLWHGFNLALLLSVIAVAAGIFLFLNWNRVRARLEGVKAFSESYGPEAGYWRGLDLLNWVAFWQTRILQNGYMRYYLITIVMTMVVLTLYAMVTRATPQLATTLTGVQIYELAIALIIVLAAVFLGWTHSRLAAVASLGIVGFGVALVYVLFSAPDLGITQVLVETLTVLLLVLVLFRLPEFLDLSSNAVRLRDLGIGLLVGGTMTLLLLMIGDVQYFEPISWYFVENSYPIAQGRNIVNVILVDFRALDTLGEIYVLALAGIGVYAMIKLRSEDQSKGGPR